jgi:hypothetical protein
LSRLLVAARAGGITIPHSITTAIVSQLLFGLHAAHGATDESGVPLGIVHRDVSPHNVLVGVDGVARVLDFGVAKARGRVQTTQNGQIKGKMAYMAPEQLRAEPVTPQTDLYAASLVLWECLVGRRLFDTEEPSAIYRLVLEGIIDPPSKFVPAAAPFDALVMRGLSRRAEDRFASAREMASLVEKIVQPAAAETVGNWVRSVASESLKRSEDLIARLERSTRLDAPQKENILPSLHSGILPDSRDDEGGIAVPPGPVTERDVGTGITEVSDAEVLLEAQRAIVGRKRVLVGVLAFFLSLFVVIAFAFGGRSGDASNGGAPSTPVPTPSVPAVTEPEPSMEGDGAPMVAAEPNTPVAIDGAADAATETRSRKHGPTPGWGPSRECDPPYVRDDSGVKVYKRECLR